MIEALTNLAGWAIFGRNRNRRKAHPARNKKMARKTPNILFENSTELCKYIAKISNGVCVLSFSGGKDSIGAWLQLRKK